MQSKVGGVIVPSLSRIEATRCQPVGEPLAELYRRYLDYCAGAQAKSTLASHRRTAYLAAGLPSHPTPGDLAIWLESLRAAGLAESTTQLHRWNLGAVYSYANACGWAHGNPADARFLRHRAGRPAPRGMAQIARFWPKVLASAPAWGWTERETCAVAVLRYQGLRLGEALGLQPSNLLRGGEVLSVTAQRSPHSWELAPLKTDKCSRSLPVRSPLRPMLARVLGLGEAKVRRGNGGGKLEPTSFLFPLTVTRLQRMGAQLAELDPVHFGERPWHAWRHSLACELHEAGKPIEQISQWLGHASIAHTQGYMARLLGRPLAADALKGLDEG